MWFAKSFNAINHATSRFLSCQGVRHRDHASRIWNIVYFKGDAHLSWIVVEGEASPQRGYRLAFRIILRPRCEGVLSVKREARTALRIGFADSNAQNKTRFVDTPRPPQRGTAPQRPSRDAPRGNSLFGTTLSG